MYKAMIKKSKNKKGFTLVELIVVMAILAILAAILIPSVSGMIKRSNEAVDLATARNLYMAGSMVLANDDGVLTVTVNSGGTAITQALTTDAAKTYIDFIGNDYASTSTKAATSLILSVTDESVTVTKNPGGAYNPNSGKFSE